MSEQAVGALTRSRVKQEEKFVIKGGCRLEGKVKVAGAKNSVLKLMTASLLTDEAVVLRNVPKITDVITMSKVLTTLGAKVEFIESGVLQIKTPRFLSPEAPYELVSQMRASIIVLGPLLARIGHAKVAMPGGCNIGSRKIDFHLRGFEMMGARIEISHGYIEAVAPTLVGARICLDFPSVGATENLLMAAVLAKGTTIIENAAREPEVVDLAHFLTKMGAKIEGAGTSEIRVEGVDRLQGVSYEVIPDRIEAATFLIAAAMTNGSVVIEGARPEHLGMVIHKLAEIGASITCSKESIWLVGSKIIKPTDVSTLPYPGFPTDLQAPIMAALAIADGTSIITENVFESRFGFVDELNRMGSKIKTRGHHAIVEGVPYLTGAPVKAPDLRGGAALVLAGLIAEDITEVRDIHHIDRGYHHLEDKLAVLGAEIRRVRSPAPTYD
jgi:UDP-N-acetylglucosamine 1-carboxyvinyltransferase